VHVLRSTTQARSPGADDAISVAALTVGLRLFGTPAMAS